jgi:hypothetical protein
VNGLGPARRTPGGEVVLVADDERKQAAVAERRAARAALWERRLAWARRELPGESPVFAAAAAGALRSILRRPPTADEVLARLRAQGRDAESLGSVAGAPPASDR